VQDTLDNAATDLSFHLVLPQSRSQEARANWEAALASKDRAIDQLEDALAARQRALDTLAASASSTAKLEAQLEERDGQVGGLDVSIRHSMGRAGHRTRNANTTCISCIHASWHSAQGSQPRRHA
jgi:hypothetical protein